MEYIRIPKELLKSEMWMYELSNDTKTFFIHLLSQATYKSCSITFMREIFDLEAGQVVMTQRDMANTLCITDRKVRTMIDNLKESKLITTKIAHSRRIKSAQDHKLKRTVVTVCNIHHYSGSFNPQTDSDNINDEVDKCALNRKEEIKEFNNKKKQIKETSQKLVQKEVEPMVMLDPATVGYREGLFYLPWIRILSELTNESHESIEKMVLKFAELKFHEGNSSLGVKSFRYNCKNFITTLLSKKDKHDVKVNAKQQRAPQPSCPQHRIADVDITRVPGHGMSIIGRKEGK